MVQWTKREIKKLRENPNENFWGDIGISPGAFQFAGTNDPTLSTWTIDGEGYVVYAFAVDDFVNFFIQAPPDWKEGTSLHPHVHWTPRTRGVAESGNTVGWQIDYSIAGRGEAFNTSSTISLTATCNGVDDAHQEAPEEATEAPAPIDMRGKKVQTTLMCKLTRVADTWATNNPAANLPALIEIDVHYSMRKESPGTYFEHEHLRPEYQIQYGIDRK